MLCILESARFKRSSSPLEGPARHTKMAPEVELSLLKQDPDDGSAESGTGDSCASSSSGEGFSWGSWRLLGPGLLVCLADTDAGCLIVAAQSGARWGYSLLLLQVALIPVLFIAQELTIRLGVYTQQGYTACIRKHYGGGWAWFACCLLVVECIGAMISEMSGIAAVAELWGLDRTLATLAAALLVSVIVIGCNYRQVETIGVICGLFELTFVLTMFLYHPAPADVFSGAFRFYDDAAFASLVAANIGAVIMPWMIYFQQSAVVARGLRTASDVAEERVQTLVGSILTQLVMIGALVTLAAAHTVQKDLNSVGDIVVSLEPVLGDTSARVLVSLGFAGGSACAAFVVSLAAAWAVSEALGADDANALDLPPWEAKEFYGGFLVVVFLGAGLLLAGVNIVTLNVWVEFIDGLLMPLAVAFLFLLAAGPALPSSVRLAGVRKWAYAAVFGTCSALSLGSAFYSLTVDS
eukprot:TRINITY_DN2570_c0_g1_i1.p1 TRINITY_DN2570_c0_g1~~TRINITY_DN2570_c0_g1_i1.p1  ORF type:complete len:509 (+),score=89.80 TRINITY_DN2570_c0_g1_i1:131-1528(+)